MQMINSDGSRAICCQTGLTWAKVFHIHCDRKISEGILGSGVLKDIVNMPEYFFEGAEKLLEMWFTSDDVKILRNADLRDIKR